MDTENKNPDTDATGTDAALTDAAPASAQATPTEEPISPDETASSALPDIPEIPDWTEYVAPSGVPAAEQPAETSAIPEADAAEQPASESPDAFAAPETSLQDANKASANGFPEIPAFTPPETPPAPKTGHTAKKRSKFRLAVLLYSAVLVVAAAIVLTVLWQFLRAYENSRPEKYMDEFVGTLDRSYWEGILREQLAGTVSPFENEAEIIRTGVDALLESDRQYLLKGDADGLNTYRVILRGKEVLTVSLQATPESVGFGLHKWAVSSFELHPDKLPLKLTKQQWTVPDSATLTVNGIAVGETYLISSGKQARECSVLEPTAACTVSVYQLSLYGTPTVSARLDGETLTGGEDGYYPYPADRWQQYVVVVPADSVLRVNGIVPDGQYRTGGGLYNGTALEPSNNIGYAVYTLPLLFDKPTVSAELEGALYELTESNLSFYLDYPTALRYTVTVSVPSGTAVSLNGIRLDASYLSGQAIPFPALEPFAQYLNPQPASDFYTVTGLYQQPAVTIALSGTELQVFEEVDEKTRTVSLVAVPVTDTETANLCASLAQTFTQTYMYYMTEGYRNTYDNLNNVLALMLPNTDSYTRMQKTKESRYWVIPAVLTYRENLTISDIVSYSDTCFECRIHYAISQNTAGTVVDSAGFLHLIFIRVNGSWKVASFQQQQDA